MPKVLITGITGFLGSNIAEELIHNNHQVIGLKRPEANIWRCEDFKHKITWIDIDAAGQYKDQLANFSIDSIIHCAWIGVEAHHRDNWEEQIKNVTFLIELLSIAKSVSINRFIFLGSQAEYGNVTGKITEEHQTSALSAYGGVKLACLEIVKAFCSTNNINWIWLRLFSLFGEKESDNWLIPTTLRMMFNGEHLDVTPGGQKYAYLYVKDFNKIVCKVLHSSIESGIYNISADKARTIKSILEDIRDAVKPSFKLNFGALGYRNNQSMHIEGDISKLTKSIGEIEFTEFNVALKDTLDYYIKNKSL
jgi:UDP-glucose 4-epimerase